MSVPSRPRSAGHIAFQWGREWFELAGEVYVAPENAPLADINNHARYGRWECSRAHFERYRAVLLPEPEEEGCT